MAKAQKGLGGVGGGSSWYILYTKSPLTFRQRFLTFKPIFEAKEGHTFFAEVRSPNEYVSSTADPDKFTSAQARDYLFNYVFVHTDDINALQRLLTHPNALLGANILHRRFINDHLEADTIAAEEIDRFFLFCRAFTLYSGQQHIPFIEIPAEYQSGALGIITAGDYKGLSVKIANRQDDVPEGHVAVFVTVMPALGVTMTLPREHVHIVSDAAYADNKYVIYDQFFSSFTHPEGRQRLLADAPTPTDIARALRMKVIAGTLRTSGPRAQRDSARLQFLKLSALLICHRILHAPEAATPLLPLWHRRAGKYAETAVAELLRELYASLLPQEES